MARKAYIKIGDKVEITSGWRKGDWGIVVFLLEGQYHVAMFGDENEALLFERDEFKKMH